MYHVWTAQGTAPKMLFPEEQGRNKFLKAFYVIHFFLKERATIKLKTNQHSCLKHQLTDVKKQLALLTQDGHW